MNLTLDHRVLILSELRWKQTPAWTLALMLNHVMVVHLHFMNLLVISWNDAMTVQSAISDQFIKGARLTTLTMPWETPLMRQIFGEDPQGARLSMPLDWGDPAVPTVGSTGSGIEHPAIPSVSCQQSFQFIRHTPDATYIQQRDKTLQSALQKWRFLVMLEPEASDVGKQLVGKDEQETELVLLYGRCRVSDVNYIHEILHDVSGSTGFLEVTTRYHKSACTAQQKALLMPILVGSVGVTAFPWIQAWISNRKACGLPTSGIVDGALMPAPLMGDSVQWLKRPLAPGEISGILKNFLKSSDENLTSHSLKATALSWAAKAEVPREQRRVLGRHAAAVQGSDTFYSRDLCVGPVNSLQKVVAMIRDRIFNPDASRSNYFAGSAHLPGPCRDAAFHSCILEQVTAGYTMCCTGNTSCTWIGCTTDRRAACRCLS